MGDEREGPGVGRSGSEPPTNVLEGLGSLTQAQVSMDTREAGRPLTPSGRRKAEARGEGQGLRQENFKDNRVM